MNCQITTHNLNNEYKQKRAFLNNKWHFGCKVQKIREINVWKIRTNNNKMNQYLFYKVKPICDEIRKNPTVENAKKLSDELSTGHCNEYLCTSRDDIILLAILQQIPELAVRCA